MNAPSDTSELSDRRPAGDKSRLTPSLVGGAIALAVIAAAGAGLFYAAHQFGSYELEQHDTRASRPRVTGSTPVSGEERVPAQATFRANLFLPGTGDAVDTLSAERGVRLTRVSDGKLIAANVTVAADSGSVTLTPIRPLTPGERYRFEVTSDVAGSDGLPFVPFAASVTIDPDSRVGYAEADLELEGVAFESVPQEQAVVEPSKFTALAWGPSSIAGSDRPDLFAGTADGRIFRFRLRNGGDLRQADVIMAVPQNNRGPRLITGLAFDPRNPQVLWVSHGVAALSGAPDFTGKLSTLAGSSYSSYADRVVGLPRAFKDHLNFGLAFDAKDPSKIYLSQGSNTGVGMSDRKWNNRPERPLTAAILKVHTDKLPAGPLDVATPAAGQGYDPAAANAPVTIHATGVRSGYTLLAHSSGKLFVPINGAGEGGNTPEVRVDGNVQDGPVMNLGVTTDDVLADVTRPGTYHGHPNPHRDEYVLMGGNPTDGLDAFEVSAYGVPTPPEDHWQQPAWSFGKGYSVNGLAESKAGAFGGRLLGHIFATRFSAGDDVILLQLDKAGRVIGQTTGIPGLTGLGSPLSILEDPQTGNLYVAEFDSGSITLLRAKK